MKRTALPAGIGALIVVFSVLTVSIVDARRPLDGLVSKSFDSAVLQLERTGVKVAPYGCRKRALDFYDCSAGVRPRRKPRSTQLRYRLVLSDDGCWSGRLAGSSAASSLHGTRGAPIELTGCVTSTRRTRAA